MCFPTKINSRVAKNEAWKQLMLIFHQLFCLQWGGWHSIMLSSLTFIFIISKSINHFFCPTNSPKPKRLSVYRHKRRRKAANSSICWLSAEAGSITTLFKVTMRRIERLLASVPPGGSIENDTVKQKQPEWVKAAVFLLILFRVSPHRNWKCRMKKENKSTSVIVSRLKNGFVLRKTRRLPICTWRTSRRDLDPPSSRCADVEVGWAERLVSSFGSV